METALVFALTIGLTVLGLIVIVFDVMKRIKRRSAKTDAERDYDDQR